MAKLVLDRNEVDLIVDNFKAGKFFILFDKERFPSRARTGEPVQEHRADIFHQIIVRSKEPGVLCICDYDAGAISNLEVVPDDEGERAALAERLAAGRS